MYTATTNWLVVRGKYIEGMKSKGTWRKGGNDAS